MRAKVNYWLNPALSSVELSSAEYFTQRFSKHWHSGFALGIVTRNTQCFHAQGREWVICPGDLILLNPGQIHDGYSRDAGGWASRMAYVPPAAFRRLAGQQFRDTARFWQPVVHAPDLWHDFLEWHCLSEASPGVMFENLTLSLFARLAALTQPASEGSEIAEPTDPPLHERIQAIAQHGSATVADLSEQLHLSRSGSWRKITGQYGIAPKPLLNHLRLIAGKQMLTAGLPIVEASLACGFHDQSHFTNGFSAAYGFTPAQYRRAWT